MKPDRTKERLHPSVRRQALQPSHDREKRRLPAAGQRRGRRTLPAPERKKKRGASRFAGVRNYWLFSWLPKRGGEQTLSLTTREIDGSDGKKEKRCPSAAEHRNKEVGHSTTRQRGRRRGSDLLLPWEGKKKKEEGRRPTIGWEAFCRLKAWK